MQFTPELIVISGRVRVHSAIKIMLVLNNFLIAACIPLMILQYIIDNEVTLWVSADRGPFKQAKIPSIYPHDSYIVDSIRSLQALVIIKHTNDQYNLYLSEEQGIYYYQSLENLVVEPRTIQLTFGNTIVDLEVVRNYFTSCFVKITLWFVFF